MTSKRLSETPEDQESDPVKRVKSSDSLKHPLQRDISKGMNPVTLLTGYYGARGERIRHVVHEGALRLPKEALDLCANSPSKKCELPALDSVSRPTVDLQRRSGLVTDLSKELVGGEQDVKRVQKTIATNRVILHDDDPVRIRGGGDADSIPNEPAGAAITQGSIQGEAPIESLQVTTTATVAPGSILGEAASASSTQVKTTTAASNASANPTVISFNEKPPTPLLSQISPEIAVGSHSSKDPSPMHNQATPNTTVTSGTPTPQAVSSGAPTTTSTEIKPASTSQVVGLSKQPAPAWEQHMPGPNDEMIIDPNTTSPKPEWFQQDQASTLEKSLLPEWFDGSSSHRTKESYLRTRAKLMEISDKLGTRYLTATMARRSVPGDAGSLMRLHNFLCSFNLINEHAINDSAPLPVSMQEPTDAKNGWDESLKEWLLETVVKQSKAKPSAPINWEIVSNVVGHGKKRAECEQQFLSMQIPIEIETASGSVERSITPDAHSMEERSSKNSVDAASISQILQQLVSSSEPNVIHSVTTAALKSTRNNLIKAQQSVAVGLAASHAEEIAHRHEARVGAILFEIVDLRMQKLENRLTLLDDVEGMLEAERVALELERRDLYTARCRHWFQGP